MRLHWAAGPWRGAMVTLALPILSACTATPPPAGSAATPSASVAPSPSSSPVIPADPFPAHDTPLTQAPADLQAAWRPYGVSIIPGRDLLDSIPPLAPIHAAGDVTVAEGRQVVTALFRANALYGWADAHAQARLRPRLAGQVYLVGKAGFAIAEGRSVIDPPCAIYPTAVTVRRLDATTNRAMAALAQSATGGYEVRASYTGPCEITVRAQDGTTSVLDTIPTAILVATGPVRNDPLLGEIFFADTAAICDGTIPALAGACAP